MTKRKKKGRKRKGKLSEAAAKKARERHWDHGMQSIPVHPDDLEGFDAMPASFTHSLKELTGWRCLECKHGFHGEWRGRPNSQKQCPRCRSTHISQQDCLYKCLNCETEYWEFPAGPLRTKYSDPSCPNKDCKTVKGKRHPGDLEERGKYVEWLNYEEWVATHSSEWPDR